MLQASGIGRDCKWAAGAVARVRVFCIFNPGPQAWEPRTRNLTMHPAGEHCGFWRTQVHGAFAVIGTLLLAGPAPAADSVKDEITKLVAEDAKAMAAASDAKQKSAAAATAKPAAAPAAAPAEPAVVQLPPVTVQTRRLPDKTTVAKTVDRLTQTVARLDRELARYQTDTVPSRLDRILNDRRWSVAGPEDADERAERAEGRLETLELERAVAASALARCVALKQGKILSREDQDALARDLQTLADLKVLQW